MSLAAAMPKNWSPLKVYFLITIILSLIGWCNLARVVRGIDKPILNLFRMFSFLGDKKLYLESSQKKNQLEFIDDWGANEKPEVYGVATMSGTKSIEILIYCHHDDWDIKEEYEIELEMVFHYLFFQKNKTIKEVTTL